MSAKRMIVAILGITAFSIVCVTSAVAANQGSANSGPSLGKWEFTGKDNTGLVWSGTLSIEKLDPTRFDPKKYPSMCSLVVNSNDPSKGERGVEAPCEWDPSTRAVSFTTGYTVTHLYSAVLSSDGKSLTQGRWTESKKNGSGQSGETIVKSGNWSAKLPAR
jgi:hypothetical protein